MCQIIIVFRATNYISLIPHNCNNDDNCRAPICSVRLNVHGYD